MIYLYSIAISRSPSSEDVYEKNFGAIWEDLPSPFLCVNKQTRAEIFDVLHKSRTFILRVTSYGANFDMFGLSCFIAQQRSRSYGDLPDLKIGMWPPHPDRPIEMFNILRHVRMLRDELRAVSHIPKLTIWFLENKIAKWTKDGGPRFDLSAPGEKEPLESDFAKVLEEFACVTNVTAVKMRLPPSLPRNQQNDDLIWHASDTIETMQGEGNLAYLQEYTLSDCGLESWEETHLKSVTAQKARAKLDAITFDGEHKMTAAEWHEFTQVWPHFETLTEWNEGGPFKGEWHYRRY